MGIVQQQAARSTAFIFLGIGIGVISRLLMPFILDKDQIGLLSLLDSVSNLFATIFCLGFAQIVVRVFPRFRNSDNGHNGFLVFSFFVAVVGAALGILSFWLLDDFVFGEEGRRGLLKTYSMLIIPVLASRVFLKVMDGYLKMLFSILLCMNLCNLPKRLISPVTFLIQLRNKIILLRLV